MMLRQYRPAIFHKILVADSIFILTPCNSFQSKIVIGNVFLGCMKLYIKLTIILGQRKYLALMRIIKIAFKILPKVQHKEKNPKKKSPKDRQKHIIS